MTTYYSAPFTAPGTSAVVYLRMDVAVLSQDIATNTSTVAWSFGFEKPSVSGSPFRSNNDCVALASVNGSAVYAASNLNYNLAGSGYWEIGSGSGVVVSHDADGTKTMTLSASYDGKTPLGTASLSASIALPAIPRNRMRVGVAGAWKQAEVYVGINGAWVMAQPYVGDAGTWKLLNNS